MAVASSIFKWLATKIPIFTALLGTILVLYLREPGEFQHPQFWAEDAIIFFSEFYSEGLASIVKPFAGYNHLLLRLGAALCGQVAPAHVPKLYFGFCLLVHVFLIGLLFSPRVNLPGKPLLALSVVLIPVRNEIFLSLTNTQWLLAIGQLLLLVTRPPQNRKELFRDSALLTCLGLTGPFVILLLPLHFLRWVLVRSRGTAVLALLAAATTVLQLWHINESVATNAAPWEYFDYLKIWTQYLWLLFFGTEGYWTEASSIAQFFFAVAGVVIYLALVAEGLRQKNNAALMLLAAGIFILIGCVAKFTPNPRLLLTAGDRYFFIPSITLVWSALILTPRAKMFALIPLLVLFNLLLLDQRFHRDRLKNFHWERHVRCLDRKPVCHIPINPPGWVLHINTPKEPT